MQVQAGFVTQEFLVGLVELTVIWNGQFQRKTKTPINNNNQKPLIRAQKKIEVTD